MYYAYGTVFIFLGLVVLHFIKQIKMKDLGLEAGNNIHQKYIQTLFKTPMNWFDKKPTG